jgi:uncharacterized damage-inducible protein DinB
LSDAGVTLLYDYNRWANLRLLAAARDVEPHARERDLEASHRSLLGTLVHVFWGEWLWLERWQGRSPKRVFGVDELRDLDFFESEWSAVWRDQSRFLAELTDDRLLACVAYENLAGERWEYPLGEMLRHVVNHSSYHRGQLALLLRRLGRVPPATDYLVFLDETAATRPGR